MLLSVDAASIHQERWLAHVINAVFYDALPLPNRDRNWRVLRALARGDSPKAIAKEAQIGVASVYQVARHKPATIWGRIRTFPGLRLSCALDAA
jgi:hypothetical protein